MTVTAILLTASCHRSKSIMVDIRDGVKEMIHVTCALCPFSTMIREGSKPLERIGEYGQGNTYSSEVCRIHSLSHFILLDHFDI